MTYGQNHDSTGKGHVAYQLIRIVGLSTSIVFASFYLVSIKSYCRKTAGDLSWPKVTSVTWGGVIGLSFPIQGVKSSCNPMFESVLNSFCSKEVFFILPSTLQMSHAWADLRSPISKFRDKHFIDTVTDINRWKFQKRSVSRCSYDKHSNFFLGEGTWRDLVTWPEVTWV